jgi:hypothetical protein
VPEAPQIPSFVITIDTEGDNAWARSPRPTTRNAAYLPRFQELCERYGLRTTWLTNHEMATSGEFVEFGRDVLARQAGEIGMHLHGWDSPPLAPLTADDRSTHPYLVEWPDEVMRAKIRAISELLETTFEVEMRSHRAGRWAFDERYARMLVDEGYVVDCSVTPHVSWRDKPGDPAGAGGSDYTRFPESPYWLDLDDISRPGSSKLLELPVSIVSRRPRPVRALAALVARFARRPSLPTRVLNRAFPPALWLRPAGGNREQLLSVVETVLARPTPVAVFMLHSSELMPGCSPTFATEASIELLYDDLEALFAHAAARGCVGLTAAEFHDRFRGSGRAEAAGAQG